jgi:hypothetical protein
VEDHGCQSTQNLLYTWDIVQLAEMHGGDHKSLKEGEKPKTKEELAAESRLKGMKALAEKAKKEGRHTGKMVKVITSTGIHEVDSRSQAARDLPRVSQ